MSIEYQPCKKQDLNQPTVTLNTSSYLREHICAIDDNIYLTTGLQIIDDSTLNNGFDNNCYELETSVLSISDVSSVSNDQTMMRNQFLTKLCTAKTHSNACLSVSSGEIIDLCETTPAKCNLELQRPLVDLNDNVISTPIAQKFNSLKRLFAAVKDRGFFSDDNLVNNTLSNSIEDVHNNNTEQHYLNNSDNDDDNNKSLDLWNYLPYSIERKKLLTLWNLRDSEILVDYLNKDEFKLELFDILKEKDDRSILSLLDLLALKYDLNEIVDDIYEDSVGDSPLHTAVRHGSYWMVYLLLIFGANPNCVNFQGATPIALAAFLGKQRLVGLLLTVGARLEPVDVALCSVIHYCAQSGLTEAAELLIASGEVDLEAVDAKQQTALDWVHQIKQEMEEEVEVETLSVWQELERILSENGAVDKSPVCEEGDQVVCDDIAQSKEPWPIAAINNFDSEMPPDNYSYLSHTAILSYPARAALVRRPIKPLCFEFPPTEICRCYDYDNEDSSNCAQDWSPPTHCRCGPKSACLGLSCACVNNYCRNYFVGSDHYSSTLNPDCTRDQHGPVVFECADFCTCRFDRCSNRLVQLGNRVPVQLYKSASFGWGVRALVDIECGRFICEYLGEIVSSEQGGYVVESRNVGNFSRFVQHSCLPNLQVVRVYFGHSTVTFPVVCLFARRPIKKFELLTLDYSKNLYLIRPPFLT